MFTDSFPYGQSEQYLNDEFQLLNKRFEKIYIVPVNVLFKKRKGVENAQIINVESELKITKTTFFFSLFTYLKLILEEGILGVFNIKNLKSIHHAWSVSNYIIEFIKAENLDFKEITCYSYWFYHSALISAFLKKKVSQIRSVSRAHMGDVYDEINPLRFPKLKLRYLDEVVTISDMILELREEITM